MKTALALQPAARRTPQSRGARTKVLNFGVAIARETPDLRRAIKRECWMRELTLGDLAKRIHLTHDHVQRMLCHGPSQKRIEPRVLNRIIDALHVSPVVANRLHLMGAREHGWRV